MSRIDPHDFPTSLVADEDDHVTGNAPASASSGSSTQDARPQSYQELGHYEYSHGRRYHSNKSSGYWLPNDEDEQTRLDLQHKLYRTALDGRLYRAPLPEEKLERVLDVGCGTGRWCIDLAEQAPNALVQGFDISPIQSERVPSNCSFYVADCNANWEQSGKYTLIHTRALSFAVSDWPRLFNQAYNALQPGGYIECQEYVLPFHCNNNPDPGTTPAVIRWSECALEANAKIGYKPDVVTEYAQMMQAAGFEDVVVEIQEWPIGAWARGDKNKVIGRLVADNFKDGMRNGVKMFTGLLNWTESEFLELMSRIDDEIDGAKLHSWTRVAFVYARKP